VAPLELLEIHSSSADPALRIHADGLYDPTIKFANDGYSSLSSIFYDRSENNLYISSDYDDTSTQGNIRFITASFPVNNPILTLESQSGAGIGIWETSPDALFELSANGGVSDLFMLSSDDNNDGDRFIVKNSGNVGIGTTTPYAKLSVVGETVSEYFTATSTTATSTFTAGINVGSGNGYFIDGVPVLWGNSISSAFNVGVNTVSSSGIGVGLNNTSSGSNSSSFGYWNIASNSISSSFGAGNSASGLYSSAFGFSNIASGPNSSAFGNNNTASGSYSATFGYGNTASATGASVFGSSISNNIDNSTMIGPSDTAKLTILSTGNVGIGTTSPYAKLSVVGETVSEYFTATSTTATTTLAGGLNVGSGSLTVLQNGNVGIGSTDPAKLLEVLDGSGDGVSLYGQYGSGYVMAEGAGDLLLGLGGSNKLVFFGSGSAGFLNINGLGVGDTTSEARLEVSANGGVSDLFMLSSDDNNDGDRFIVKNSGNVGIGTTSPYAKLSVVGETVSEYFTATSTTATTTLAGGLNLGSGGLVYDYASGNVGINTTSPGQALEVSGKIQTTNAGGNSIGDLNVGPDGFYSWNGASRFVRFNTSGAVNDITSGGADLAINYTSGRNVTIGAAYGQPSKLSIIGNLAVGDSVFTDTAAPSNGVSIQGNVGIGTTSPYAKLSVVGETVSEYFTATSTTATTTLAGGLNIGNGKLVYDYSSGNVGINTTSPTAWLNIDAPSGGAEKQFIRVENSGNVLFSLNQYGNFSAKAGATFGGVAGVSPSSAAVVVNPNSSSNRGLSIKEKSGQTASTFQVLDSLDNVLFNIAGGGNVGIGTTSPYAKLSVVGETVSEYFTATSTTATSTFAGSFSIDNGAFEYDSGAGVTTISNLQMGAMSFVENAGVISWTDLPVSSSAPDGTDESYSAQIDGNSLLTIYSESDGVGGIKNTGVNIGTTTILYSSNIPWGSLIVGDGILCVDNGGDNCDDVARTRGTIYANNATVSGLDLAEQYPTRDTELEAGDIIMLDKENPVFVKRFDSNSSSPAAIGVVSTKPGLLLGGFDSGKFKQEVNVPVALSGRVPVKVNMEGGEINKGDKITFSTVIGVGKKATTYSYTIGIALEDFTKSDIKDSGYGKILVFIDLGWSKLDSAISGDTITTLDGEGGSAFWQIDKSSGRIKIIAPIDMDEFDIVNVRAIRGLMGKWSINEDGLLVVDEVDANRIKTDVLCVEDICVNKDKFKEIFGNGIDMVNGNTQTADVGGSDSSANSNTDGDNNSTSTEIPPSTTTDTDDESVINDTLEEDENESITENTAGEDGSDSLNNDTPPAEESLSQSTPNTQPTITLTGDSVINLTEGDTYTEQGAIADDVEDGSDLPVTDITGTVDTNTPGTYIIFYNFTDLDGLAADEVTRIVEVEEVEKEEPIPVITPDKNDESTESVVEQGSTS